MHADAVRVDYGNAMATFRCSYGDKRISKADIALFMVAVLVYCSFKFSGSKILYNKTLEIILD